MIFQWICSDAQCFPLISNGSFNDFPMEIQCCSVIPIDFQWVCSMIANDFVSGGQWFSLISNGSMFPNAFSEMCNDPHWIPNDLPMDMHWCSMLSIDSQWISLWFSNGYAVMFNAFHWCPMEHSMIFQWRSSVVQWFPLPSNGLVQWFSMDF